MTSRFFTVGALPLALAACTTATPLPDSSYLTAAATPTVAVRQTGYANPIRNYTPRPVTDPGDWRQSNAAQEGR
jgi:hypothetical protein